MCELLGLSFNQPVRCSLSFRGFCHRARHNPDGWGIARFDGKCCQVFKEPITGSKSKLATFLRDYESFVSKIFIGHVRYTSRGDPALQNTHPFSRTFRSREVAIAHNGTLDLVGALDPRTLKFKPVGDTDSEYLFCAFLSKLSADRIRFADFQTIEAILREFNQFGTMNLVISEGEHLYSNRDQNGYNSLWMIQRAAPFGRVSLRDEDWEVDLAEEKHRDQRGVVIATHPLRNEKWSELPPGCLHVFKEGRCIYGA